MSTNDVTAVIVTFNSEHKIFSCLDSIPIDTKVIIVENSNNFSFKKSVETHRKNVECFLLKNNEGYAFANNYGLKKVNTKYALILNPDVRLFNNTIDNFILTASKIRSFWIIGPNQNLNNKKTKIDKEIYETKDIKGYAMFLNIDKFKNKFFDDKFFLYFEEIDLCKQVKKKGGSIFVDKNILLVHDGGSSVKIKSFHELEKNRNWHWMWSSFYFHKKHKGFLLAFIIIFPKLFSIIFKILIFTLLQQKQQKEIYICRLSGIFNSLLGKKSWYRPKLN